MKLLNSVVNDRQGEFGGYQNKMKIIKKTDVTRTEYVKGREKKINRIEYIRTRLNIDNT